MVMRSRHVYCACACTRLVLRQCVGGVFVTSRRSDELRNIVHYATKACTTGRSRTAGPSHVVVRRYGLAVGGWSVAADKVRVIQHAHRIRDPNTVFHGDSENMRFV